MKGEKIPISFEEFAISSVQLQKKGKSQRLCSIIPVYICARFFELFKKKMCVCVLACVCYRVNYVEQ